MGEEEMVILRPRICGGMYEVRLVPPDHFAEDVEGDLDMERQIIRISTALSPQRREEVLFHEMGEATRKICHTKAIGGQGEAHDAFDTFLWVFFGLLRDNGLLRERLLPDMGEEGWTTSPQPSP